MTIQKTKEEALRILLNHFGQPISVMFNWITKYHSTSIDTQILKEATQSNIKSFCLNLRSKDEMTDEEIVRYDDLQKEIDIDVPCYSTTIYADSPASIDYLRSIGIDTDNLKGVTIEII